jgi:hypothetical protein
MLLSRRLRDVGATVYPLVTKRSVPVQRPGGGAIGSARRIRRGVFGVDYASTTSSISKTKPRRV